MGYSPTRGDEVQNRGGSERLSAPGPWASPFLAVSPR
jgi:hypothetical protein